MNATHIQTSAADAHSPSQRLNFYCGFCFIALLLIWALASNVDFFFVGIKCDRNIVQCAWLPAHGCVCLLNFIGIHVERYLTQSKPNEDQILLNGIQNSIWSHHSLNARQPGLAFIQIVAIANRQGSCEPRSDLVVRPLPHQFNLALFSFSSYFFWVINQKLCILTMQ